MDNTIQLYTDEERTVKGYPITSPDRVIDEDGVSIKKQIDDISEQLDNIAINVKMYGAKGDGITDDTVAFQNALKVGGNIFIPAGTYKITKELLITSSNTKIFGYGINKSILKYEGRGTDGNFFFIKGKNADEFIENISINRITIDCEKQWYKGGNSDETPKETSPRPKYLGMVGIYVEYGKHIIIEDVMLNDVYGDGIKIRRSSHCTINRNKLYNCGSGNIINNTHTGWDNHGDGIVAFFSYNIDITNNVVINRRVYLTHESNEGDVSDVYGLPCGRSGLEFEYRMDQDAPSSTDINPIFNAPGYADFITRDGFGLNMSNNYVYGYTKGIHMESDVRCLITSNKMIKNHIGILHSGGALTHIVSNYISNEGLTVAPQHGYDMYSGGIIITGYSIDNLVLVEGNIIDITTTDKSKKIQAIALGRGCIRIVNNSIRVDSFGIYEIAEREDITTRGVFVLNNEFVSKDNNDATFIFKYYSRVEWIISGNSFTNSNTSKGSSSIILNSTSVDKGGLIINNNIFNNTRLDFKGSGYNIDISSNVFYVFSSFTVDESIIRFDNIYNVKIEQNRFYIYQDCQAKHCINLRDNAEYLFIRKNIFNIANDYMTVCCNLPNNIYYLSLEKNIINTPSTNFIFSSFNWINRNPVIKENKISNPHCNVIVTGGSMMGLVDIDNNVGLINYHINPNFKYEGLFIPLGFVLKDYSQNTNKNVYGEICVVEGLYTETAWTTNTKYTAGNYIAHNDNVYKVNSDFTSESTFNTDNLTEMGKQCKLKTINLL